MDENGSNMIYKYKKAVDSFGGKHFIIIADLRSFKQPTPESKNAIGKMMDYASKNGLYRSIQVLNRTLLKMVISSTAEGKLRSDKRIVVTSLEEALQKAKQFEKELI